MELAHLDQVIAIFQDYCQQVIKPEDLEKVVLVDTILLDHERNDEELKDIAYLAPFGEGNQEPMFLLEKIKVLRAEVLGKKNNHLKIYGEFGTKGIVIMMR